MKYVIGLLTALTLLIAYGQYSLMNEVGQIPTVYVMQTSKIFSASSYANPSEMQETINFAKLLVKKKKDLMVGGVLASIQPKELEAATGIKPWVGILGAPGILDKGDTQIIDNLPRDYSILDEIEYKYPMANAFYGYMTRGCIRHCAFCAVPTLENNTLR